MTRRVRKRELGMMDPTSRGLRRKPLKNSSGPALEILRLEL
jgi:hypothetical protein